MQYYDGPKESHAFISTSVMRWLALALGIASLIGIGLLLRGDLIPPYADRLGRYSLLLAGVAANFFLVGLFTRRGK